MAYSKFSILVVEEDSRVSRVIRDRLEKAFPEIRVEIAGSPAKAKSICTKFPPSWIVWDGACRDGAFLEDYVASVPDGLWTKVIPISCHSAALEAAKSRGALTPLSKQADALHSWSDNLVHHLKKLVPAKKR